MERPVKIFIAVTIGVVILIGLGFYSSWFKSEKAKENLTFINEQDPLLLNAKQKGQATLPEFFKLFNTHPNSSFVRFPHLVNDLEVHIWAPVNELTNDYAEVTITPGPDMPSVITEKQTLQLATGQIEDWLVTLPNGTVRGGFTTQAILLNALKRESSPKDSIEKQLDLFQDPL